MTALEELAISMADAIAETELNDDELRTLVSFATVVTHARSLCEPWVLICERGRDGHVEFAGPYESMDQTFNALRANISNEYWSYAGRPLAELLHEIRTGVRRLRRD